MMRYSRIIKLGAVAAALLLIPRRSSRKAHLPDQSGQRPHPPLDRPDKQPKSKQQTNTDSI